MLTDDLDENYSVTLDGSGNGTARATPGQAGSPGSGVGAARYSGLVWELTGVAVQVATNVKEAQASCYVSRGIQSANSNTFQGQTQQGSTGDTCTVTANLRPGDWVIVKWSGGDAGAIATMRVTGTVQLPGGM